MNRVLILAAIFFLVLMMVSCGGEENTEDTSKNFPNEHDGLDWSDASSSYMTWDEAVTYCENLGGRLPTISELRTLIQNCPGTETGSECEVNDNYLSSDCWTDSCGGCEYDESGKYSVFGDTNWFWSSSELSDYANGAWYVNFGSGAVHHSHKHDDILVRCVR